MRIRAELFDGDSFEVEVKVKDGAPEEVRRTAATMLADMIYRHVGQETPDEVRTEVLRDVLDQRHRRELLDALGPIGRARLFD